MHPSPALALTTHCSPESSSISQGKETLWRLAYDALPTAARLHRDEPCVCGDPSPRPCRHHYFSACPVAAAVVSDV